MAQRRPRRLAGLRLDPARDRPQADEPVRRGAGRPLRRPPRGQRGAPAEHRPGAADRGAAAAAARRPRTSCAEPDFVHPSRYLEFLRGAAGVTVVTEELNEFNPAGRPHRVVRPGTDTRALPSRPRAGARARAARALRGGLRPRLQRHHPLRQPARHAQPLPGGEAAAARRLRGEAGPDRQHRPGGRRPRLARRRLPTASSSSGLVADWREIPRYLALADAFVQPGAPDEFNRYRLPSKVAEFLAMGRPVILPRCNIGNELTEGENAMLLETGELARDRRSAAAADRRPDRSPSGSGAGAQEVRRGEPRAGTPTPSCSPTSTGDCWAQPRRPGPGGPGRRWLSPSPICRPRRRPGDTLWPVVERYRGRFPLAPISYGTARDFADSADQMPGLISANGDMKDLQRCWMVKAVLGNVEPGARILEIGAGEPLVAGDALALRLPR